MYTHAQIEYTITIRTILQLFPVIVLAFFYTSIMVITFASIIKVQKSRNRSLYESSKLRRNSSASFLITNTSKTTEFSYAPKIEENILQKFQLTYRNDEFMSDFDKSIQSYALEKVFKKSHGSSNDESIRRSLDNTVFTRKVSFPNKQNQLTELSKFKDTKRRSSLPQIVTFQDRVETFDKKPIKKPKLVRSKFEAEKPETPRTKRQWLPAIFRRENRRQSLKILTKSMMFMIVPTLFVLPSYFACVFAKKQYHPGLTILAEASYWPLPILNPFLYIYFNKKLKNFHLHFLKQKYKRFRLNRESNF